eukprot:GHVN01096247.1.p1 GENE.GHVN01096247.1~~GHVN01096247.1.p1  ORF type:complete len:195 (+),score=18.52 GHVN01096247.1:41-625(+)
MGRLFCIFLTLPLTLCLPANDEQIELPHGSKFELEHLEYAIKNAKWEVAQGYILEAHKQDRDVAASVRSAVTKMKQDADELIRLLDKAHAEVSEISPAFQWAQSSTSIFFQIKFGYRWSSPGALSVQNETVTVTPTKFEFDGIGSGSFSKTRYRLTLDLFGDVEAEVTILITAFCELMTAVNRRVIGHLDQWEN